jgi:cytochrome d ubiquinol oxidase subunit I
VMAVLFAVGAVTGTVLSFEMGLLWPGMFDRFGAVIGVPFAIEGLAFFVEAIFVGIYLYGWKRLSPKAHLWSGIPIVLSGVLGTASVISANSWMNQPSGFTVAADGSIHDIQPLGAMLNRAMAYEAPHMLVAAYMVAGFSVASIYAVGWLRGKRRRYHRIGFLIPFVFASVAAPVQVVIGDFAARAVFTDQPSKFAAMELITHTGPDQAMHLGGVLVDGKIVGGIPIPGLDSILAGFSTSTRITGFDEVPVDEQPPPNIVHLSFQVMVMIGTGLVALGAWFGFVWWRRRRLPASRWFWRAAALAGIGSVVALEAGWITTEVGRQPWIVYKLMRVDEAVTPNGGLWWTFGLVVVLYAALGTAAVLVIRGMTRRWQADDVDDVDEVADAGGTSDVGGPPPDREIGVAP